MFSLRLLRSNQEKQKLLKKVQVKSLQTIFFFSKVLFCHSCVLFLHYNILSFIREHINWHNLALTKRMILRMLETSILYIKNFRPKKPGLFFIFY